MEKSTIGSYIFLGLAALGIGKCTYEKTRQQTIVHDSEIKVTKEISKCQRKPKGKEEEIQRKA